MLPASGTGVNEGAPSESLEAFGDCRHWRVKGAVFRPVTLRLLLLNTPRGLNADWGKPVEAKKRLKFSVHSHEMPKGSTYDAV